MWRIACEGLEAGFDSSAGSKAGIMHHRLGMATMRGRKACRPGGTAPVASRRPAASQSSLSSRGRPPRSPAHGQAAAPERCDIASMLRTMGLQGGAAEDRLCVTQVPGAAGRVREIDAALGCASQQCLFKTTRACTEDCTHEWSGRGPRTRPVFSVSYMANSLRSLNALLFWLPILPPMRSFMCPSISSRRFLHAQRPVGHSSPRSQHARPARRLLEPGPCLELSAGTGVQPCLLRAGRAWLWPRLGP